jgi:hypothetical protein
MKLLSSLLLVLAMQSASAQQPPSFDCPTGAICTEFTDGCNTCSSPDGNTAAAACTEMFCECYNDDSCVPQCLDNDQCVPIDATPPSLFECPEGTVCTEYTDGCNSCTAPNGDLSMAGCTEMWCECYDNNSCVPQCMDNEECVVPTTPVVPTTGSCTPSDEALCPVAGCAPPGDAACQYQEGDFVLDGEGNCCREQCVFVNTNGERCTFGEDMGITTQEDMGVTTAEDIGVTTEEGDKTEEDSTTATTECTPAGDEACPVATCMQLQEGCEYKFDHYVLDSDGVCCASLCYAVDSNGNECPHEDSGEDQDAINLQPGDMCMPLKVDTVAATATTKQATEPEDVKCPIASCATAPQGCEYKMDHYVINGVGDCCPELCYAVDSDGNECTQEGLGSGSDSGRSDSGSSKHSLWLGSSLIVAAVLLLANN